MNRTLWTCSLGCALCLFLVPLAAFSQIDDASRVKGVITVLADGEGVTETGALQDALRNAVRKACGQFLHGETIVRKDQIIRDEVLSIAEGIVDDYDELESRRENGLIKKTIRARVQRRALAGILLKSSLAGNSFDGKKLFARVVSRIEKDQDARELFQKLMTSFLENVVAGEIVSEPDMVTREGERLTLDYKLAIRVDPVKYQDFISRLFMVADRAAAKKGTLTSRSFPDSLAASHLFQGIVEKNARIADVTTSKIRRFAPTRSAPWLTQDFNPRTHMILLVNESQKQSTGETGWRWYHFPIASSLHHHGRFLTTFADDSGRTVYQDELKLGPILPGFNVLRQPLASPNGISAEQTTQVIICPFLVSGRYYCSQMTLFRSMAVTLNDLRSIRRTDFKIIVEENSEERLVSKKTARNTADSLETTEIARLGARDLNTTKIYPRGSPRTSYRNSARAGSFAK